MKRTKIGWYQSSCQKQSKWQDKGIVIIEVLKENYCQPRILYLAKISFKNESEIKTFLGKWKLKEFIRSRPTQTIQKASDPSTVYHNYLLVGLRHLSSLWTLRFSSVRGEEYLFSGIFMKIRWNKENNWHLLSGIIVPSTFYLITSGNKIPTKRPATW